MSTPLELYGEQLSQALLRQSGALLAIIPTGRIFVQSEDTAADPANKDRIVCKATPRQPEVTGLNPSSVLVWRVPVEVALYYSTDDAAKLQTAICEIENAMAAAPQTAALALITASGIRCQDPTPDGDFTNEDNGRKRSKTFHLLAELV